jgi:TonB family protein
MLPLLLALSVSLCSVQVRGAIARDVIRREIRAHRNELRGCYERERVRRPQAEGRVTLQLTIDSDGWTNDIVVDASEVGGAELASCLRERVKTWRFPSMRFQGGAERIAVRYPLVFRPSGRNKVRASCLGNATHAAGYILGRQSFSCPAR